MRLVGSERYSPGSHLNLKWTVADTDRIISWAKAHWTASEIAVAFTAEGKRTLPAEIIKICSDAGQIIKDR
jgi:hypothetical protein